MSVDPFWELPEVVEQFAAREPDRRLSRLIDQFDRPESIRVLDLGCAGGRNSVFLAERGFEVHAVDASEAMVERTRDRLDPIIGDAVARDRVRLGGMDDLSHLPDRSFDLVIALGIFHNSRSVDAWERAVAETTSVLKPGAQLLLNHFTPEVKIKGESVHPVPGVSHLFDGFPGGRVVLFNAADLDAAMERHGLRPVVPSETVRVESLERVRVSVNALYRRET